LAITIEVTGLRRTTLISKCRATRDSVCTDLLFGVWGFGSVATRTILDVAFVNHIVPFSLSGGQWAVTQDTHEILVHVSGPKKIRADFKKLERVFDGSRVTVAKALASSSNATNECE